MVRMILSLGLLVSLVACDGGASGGDQAGAPPAGSASAGGAPVGASGTATRTMIENAAQSPDHKMLVGAIRSAGLEKVFAGAGPYTLFAPTDAAFAKLPAGAAHALMQPEAKARLTRLLSYHVVPGVVTAADLRNALKRRGGRTELATMGGGKLTVAEADGGLVLTDSKGGQARITSVDAIQSNGVVHVIDAVLMPQ